MAGRRRRQSASGAPVSIYEVHLGSWRRVPEEGDRFLDYRELGRQLGDYARDMGFTHVELLPVMEHPFYGSWGYQTIGYYAPTRRYGAPQDFMAFVDELHPRGIGVLLDWVPAHFPQDAHGLAFFDGTHLYEHEDPRRREHPDWGTRVFNYGRREVANFLIGNALFWLERYHLDGLRVDAVASMLYLDYSRRAGRVAAQRLRRAREPRGHRVHQAAQRGGVRRPPRRADGGGGVHLVAPGVAADLRRRASASGSSGTWAGCTTCSSTSATRRCTGSITTTCSRSGCSTRGRRTSSSPLSHDEVVHGKGSLLGKMPGDDWQRFANLRSLYGFMWAYPGKKLLFMGGEFGQSGEWNHDRSLDWHLLDAGPYHRGVQALVRDLNRLYRDEPALHALDHDPAGFAWMDCNDADQSVISFCRFPAAGGAPVLCVANFTPVPRQGYRVGVPHPGQWVEVLNTDGARYGGSDVGNGGGVWAEPVPAHGQPCSLRLTLPPLGVVLFRQAT